MPSGKVKWFNAKKGYGFITDDKSKKDIFLHVSSLEKYLESIEGRAIYCLRYKRRKR